MGKQNAIHMDNGIVLSYQEEGGIATLQTLKTLCYVIDHRNIQRLDSHEISRTNPYQRQNIDEKLQVTERKWELGSMR